MNTEEFLFLFSVVLNYHNGMLQLLAQQLNSETSASMGVLKTLVNELASREVSILQVISSNTGVIALTEKDCSWVEQLCQASIIENEQEASINANTIFTFDFEYVQSQIIRAYFLLCPINYRHIVQKYQCHTRRAPNTIGHADIDGLDLDERYRVPLSEEQMDKEWSYLKVMPLDKLYHAYGLLRQIAITLKVNSEVERASTNLFDYVRSTDHDDDVRQRLEQYEINNFALCHLYHVIRIYAELIHGFSHLFTNVSSLLQVPLDSQVNEELTQRLYENLIQSTDANDDERTDMIQARILAITQLLQDLSGIEDSLLQQAAQPLVKTCEYLAIENDLLQWIPEGVRCEHYVPLSIHLIRLRSSLQERKVNIEEKEVKRWTEQSYDQREKAEDRFQPYAFSDQRLTTFDPDLISPLDTAIPDPSLPVDGTSLASSRLFELQMKMVPCSSSGFLQQVHQHREETRSEPPVINKPQKFATGLPDRSTNRILLKAEKFYEHLQKIFEERKYDVEHYVVLDKNEISLDLSQAPRHLGTEHRITIKEHLVQVQFQFQEQVLEFLTTPINATSEVVQHFLRSPQMRSTKTDVYLCFCDQYGACLEEGTIGDLTDGSTRLAMIYVAKVPPASEMLCETVITPNEGMQMHTRCLCNKE